MKSITIYSKTTCPQCVQAKALLTEWGFAYSEFNIELDQLAMDKILGMGLRSVPQIFLESDLLEGGFQALQRLGKDGLAVKVGKADLGTI